MTGAARGPLARAAEYPVHGGEAPGSLVAGLSRPGVAMRRSLGFARGIALLSALVGVLCVLPGARPALGGPASGGDLAQARDKLRHVVVIVQENRSFDH